MYVNTHHVFRIILILFPLHLGEIDWHHLLAMNYHSTTKSATNDCRFDNLPLGGRRLQRLIESIQQPGEKFQCVTLLRELETLLAAQYDRL